MRPIKTKFNGLLVFKGKTFYDQRGFLRETYKQKLIKKNLKFTILSKSKKMFYEAFICKLKIHKQNIFRY